MQHRSPSSSCLLLLSSFSSLSPKCLMHNPLTLVSLFCNNAMFTERVAAASLSVISLLLPVFLLLLLPVLLLLVLLNLDRRQKLLLKLNGQTWTTCGKRPGRVPLYLLTWSLHLVSSPFSSLLALLTACTAYCLHCISSAAISISAKCFQTLSAHYAHSCAGSSYGYSLPSY